MTTNYRTKLFRSVMDCGCNLGLGEFDEEARIEDVEKWLKERGYVIEPLDRIKIGEPAKQSAAPNL